MNFSSLFLCSLLFSFVLRPSQLSFMLCDSPFYAFLDPVIAPQLRSSACYLVQPLLSSINKLKFFTFLKLFISTFHLNHQCLQTLSNFSKSTFHFRLDIFQIPQDSFFFNSMTIKKIDILIFILKFIFFCKFTISG